MPPWEGAIAVTDARFSKPGKPATDFEQDLLKAAAVLEDPWVEIANMVGLDNAMRIMDAFARCHLTCPARESFVARMHRVWQETETLRLLQVRPRLTMRDIAHRIGVPRETFRKRRARALRRVPRRKA